MQALKILFLKTVGLKAVGLKTVESFYYVLKNKQNEKFLRHQFQSFFLDKLVISSCFFF
jgi:hypothetical protein